MDVVQVVLGAVLERDLRIAQLELNEFLFFLRKVSHWKLTEGLVEVLVVVEHSGCIIKSFTVGPGLRREVSLVPNPETESCVSTLTKATERKRISLINCLSDRAPRL